MLLAPGSDRKWASLHMCMINPLTWYLVMAYKCMVEQLRSWMTALAISYIIFTYSDAMMSNDTKFLGSDACE